MAPPLHVECGRRRIFVRPWGPEYQPLFTLKRDEKICQMAREIKDRSVLLVFLLLAIRLPPERAYELARSAPYALAELVFSFLQMPRRRRQTFLGKRAVKLAALYRRLLELRTN